MKIILPSFIIFLLFACTKYSQPSEPKLSGEWQIDLIEYFRIEDGDTIDNLIYLPGDLYTNPNDNSPLDSMAPGFTRFHMDYSMISFQPKLIYGGRTIWSEQYFYHVTEVSHICPGFIKFKYNDIKQIWKVKQSGYTNLILELKGQWDPQSYGYYDFQTSATYDAVNIRCTRLGP